MGLSDQTDFGAPSESDSAGTPITSDIGQVYGSFYRLDESGYGVQCGLPAAGFTHNREDLVILWGEGDTVECANGAPPIRPWRKCT